MKLVDVFPGDPSSSPTVRELVLLGADDLGEPAAARHELLVGASLSDAPRLQQHDDVALSEVRQTVRHQQSRLQRGKKQAREHHESIWEARFGPCISVQTLMFQSLSRPPSTNCFLLALSSS